MPKALIRWSAKADHILSLAKVVCPQSGQTSIWASAHIYTTLRMPKSHFSSDQILSDLTEDLVTVI